MIWLQIAYLLALIYIALKLEDPIRRKSFREAWISFALTPLVAFFTHLLRILKHDEVQVLHLITYADQAIQYLLLGISFCLLVNVIAPRAPKRKKAATPVTPDY